MSRAVFATLLLFPSPAFAQSPDKPAKDVAELVKVRSAEIITVEDKKKCPEVVESDGIVVCPEIDNGEDQLIFADQRVKRDRAQTQMQMRLRAFQVPDAALRRLVG